MLSQCIVWIFIVSILFFTYFYSRTPVEILPNSVDIFTNSLESVIVFMLTELEFHIGTMKLRKY